VKNFILPFIWCLTFRHGNMYSNANIPIPFGQGKGVLTFAFMFKNVLLLATDVRHIVFTAFVLNLF
jgi:hypothetical protein